MSTRWEVERAVFASDMSAQRRLVMLALLSLVDAKTAVVPAEYSPSLSRLVDMTGLARSTVAKELNGLEADGWVDRKRPTVAAARSAKERTRYRLAIPRSGPSRGPELVRTTDQKASPSHGLASPHHGPALVRGADTSSPHHGLNTDLEPKPSSSSGLTSPVTRIAEALSIEEEEAQGIFNRIRTERRPVAPSRYVDTLIASGDIEQFHTNGHRTAVATYTGPRCDYTPGPGFDAGFCDRCHLPASHASHRSAA